MLGGHGSRAMTEISERLDEMGDRLQLILICGHNMKLAEDLIKQPGRLKKHIVGFTTAVFFRSTFWPAPDAAVA
jgi:hypothetical protein